MGKVENVRLEAELPEVQPSAHLYFFLRFYPLLNECGFSCALIWISYKSASGFRVWECFFFLLENLFYSLFWPVRMRLPWLRVASIGAELYSTKWRRLPSRERLGDETRSSQGDRT